MTRVIRYIFNDILQTRFILIYTIFLLISSFALFQLDNDFGKVVLSLLNIVLMVVPLVSVVFTTIHFFSSYEFIELMLAQPINRRVIFLSEYIAVTSSLCMSFLIGVGVPFIMFGAGQQVVSLLFTGIFLTLVFVSLAFLSSVLTRDKSKARASLTGIYRWFSSTTPPATFFRTSGPILFAKIVVRYKEGSRTWTNAGSPSETVIPDTTPDWTCSAHYFTSRSRSIVTVRPCSMCWVMTLLMLGPRISIL